MNIKCTDNMFCYNPGEKYAYHMTCPGVNTCIKMDKPIVVYIFSNAIQNAISK